MQDVKYLYINAFLWLITLFYWWRRKPNNVGVLVLALYTAIACISCHLYKSPEADFNSDSVYIFPLLYLYVTIILLIRPLFGINYHNVSVVKLPPLKAINTICLYIIFCAAYEMILSLPNIQDGLNLMILDSSNAVDAYIDTTNTNMERKSMSGPFNILGILISTGVNFSMLFFFIYLLYPGKNKWILYGMLMALLINPVESLASGSREKLVVTLLVFLFMFFLLRPFLSSKTNKAISYGSIIASGLLLFLFFIISYARAKGETDTFIFNFENYFGMSFLEFDQRCMSANGTREGNLVSPLLNVIFGGHTYSQTELRNKYASLGVDNGTFYTFVGDFVLDYGPILAFCILLLIAIFFYKRLKIKNSFTVGHVILYYTLLKLLSGFYLHQFPGIGGNLFIIELALLYIFFSNTHLISYKRIQ